jgi:integrase
MPLIYEETKKLPEVFTKEEISLILETCNKIKTSKFDNAIFFRKRAKCIIFLCYSLALRPLEVLSLRFDDFNFKTMQIHIRAETNKERSERFLPIIPEIEPYLESYLSLPRLRFWGSSSYLFPSHNNKNKHLSSERWKGIFRQILKDAGLYIPCKENETVPRYRTYTLRHTRLSEIFEKSGDIYLVSNIAGHRKITSSNIYIHKSKDYMNYIKEKMSNLN